MLCMGPPFQHRTATLSRTLRNQLLKLVCGHGRRVAVTERRGAAQNTHAHQQTTRPTREITARNHTSRRVLANFGATSSAPIRFLGELRQRAVDPKNAPGTVRIREIGPNFVFAPPDSFLSLHNVICVT